MASNPSSNTSTSANFTSQFVAVSDIQKEGTPLWGYVTVLDHGNKKTGGTKTWQCNYCQNVFNGTYSRVKNHLLRNSGMCIMVCPKVTIEHIAEMQSIVEAADARRKPNQVPLPPPRNPIVIESSGGNKRRAFNPIEKAFNQGLREKAAAEIARMFYSAGLSFNLARNPHYISAFQFCANNLISGFKPSGYNSLRTTLLQRERANVERLIQPIKNTWGEKGVSIVTDGWTDVQRRPLINFMATSDGSPVFLKAIDGSKEYKDKNYIAQLMKSVIEEVGAKNVVQIITDNAHVCKAAGFMIEAEYPSIFWTPCVVHTLNVALKNICATRNTERNEVVYDECHWITQISDDVVFIRNFIMNHSMRLAMVNGFVPLKLLAIADTRFASIIVMLKRLKLIKFGLQSMVISEQWSTYKDDVGKASVVRDIVLNEIWWDKVDYILSFTKPIYDMLRLCDTDKPTLHLIYDLWDSMIENVKATIYKHEEKQLTEESSFYNVVYEVLLSRWTKSCTPLHCLAHSLNPRYYSKQWLNEAPNRVPPHKDLEIASERQKCLNRYFEGNQERHNLKREFTRFSGQADYFSCPDCIDDMWILDAKEWWTIHGAAAPMLQNIALKLFGQPCSSSCCERNWSTYSFIHSMKRNKIHPKRAEDLVYVHTNLRLLSRKTEKYSSGETKMWDIVGDNWEDGVDGLEVATLSLDEPAIEVALIGDNDDDGNGERDDEIDT